MSKKINSFTIVQQKIETESTMDDLAKILRAGHGHGAVCTARSQRAGRGRLPGRIWQNPSDALMFSVALAADSIKVVYPPTQILALALCRHLEKAHGLEPRIKWPNDVLLAGKKTAGILVEQQDKFYICGIGLNLEAAPEELQNKATGLSKHLNPVPKAKEELEGILVELEDLLNNPVSIAEVEKRLAYVGQRIKVKPGIPAHSEEIIGHIAGLNKDGSLLVDKGKGELASIYSGEIDFS